jgi:hypothetical protein
MGGIDHQVGCSSTRQCIDSQIRLVRPAGMLRSQPKRYSLGTQGLHMGHSFHLARNPHYTLSYSHGKPGYSSTNPTHSCVDTYRLDTCYNVQFHMTKMYMRMDGHLRSVLRTHR